MSAIMYRQHYTFSNRPAPSGSELEAVCVCLCANMLTQVHFTCAKPPSIIEGGRANIFLIHCAEQHFLFIHTSEEWGT